MSATVATALAECEAIIERGLATFVEVGAALQKIRAAKLYREGHGSFDAYCVVRWGFTSSRARRLIDAVEIAKSVPIGTLSNEAQARELAPLKDDPPAMAEVMQEASANGSKPTAKAVKAAVQKRVAPKLPTCPGCDKPVDPAKKGNVWGELAESTWHGKCWDAHLAEVAKASDEADAAANRDRHAKGAPAVAAIDAILTEQAEDAPTESEIVRHCPRCRGEITGDDAFVDHAGFEWHQKCAGQPEDREAIRNGEEPDGKPVAFADVVIRVVGGADRALKPIRISRLMSERQYDIARVVMDGVLRQLENQPLKIAKGKS